MQFVEASDLQDFHLLGLSLGALVSAAYATQHGERIATLTCMCPPGNNHYACFIATFTFVHSIELPVNTFYLSLIIDVKIQPTEPILIAVLSIQHAAIIKVYNWEGPRDDGNKMLLFISINKLVTVKNLVVILIIVG